MAITRFFTLIAFSIGAAQLACAAVIPTAVFSESPTNCPTSFSKPSGDALAPTDIPQDGFNISAGPLGCPPSFSASGLPDALPSGFPPAESADGSAPTDIPGDGFKKSGVPSQSDTLPTNTASYPSGASPDGSAPTQLPRGYLGSLSQLPDSPSSASDGATPTDTPQNGSMPSGSGNAPPSFSQGGDPSAFSSYLPSAAPSDGAVPSDLPTYDLSSGSLPQGCPTAFPSSVFPSGGPAPTDAA
ncbi:uncharacterized protein LACBIDRAFT_312252 [Laccaria bicolor S238N-H82]|uniref:Predicted protein n=1 Tax=Laccaria bicolor (strain S238N-H82 / ATCC MYA-4686) TaxID=486041 RepID=B0DVT5_LACBS|nr:uncharacterized protein LACBIDRAFT_312252 [Laccaria bicolor S238N-H82]EDR01309.1 predicted protein [Laccaria bicolor S238N-H82]|eukprot:XP_001888016.1 predicted protein [Laccaria bicolor S238N-H82]